MKIYFATIDHKHGTNSYAEISESKLKEQIAEYCEEWWGEYDFSQEMPEDYDERIDLYFDVEMNGRETLEYFESALQLEGTPFKQLTEEEARDKTEMIYVEMESGLHLGVDFTYMDQVEEFKLVLPTGEIFDSSQMKDSETLK